MKPIKFTGCDCEVIPGQFNINNIKLDCPAVWKMISGGYTIGVFQLEKKLGQDWAKKLKPDNINELGALISILRPGCLESGTSQSYVDVKFGKSKIAYLHPLLESILKNTYGQMIYQEQSLRIATDLAGFSPEDGDTLRKSIGKKNVDLMSSLKNKFIDGCQKHQKIGKGIAEEIFSWIEKCQRYQFNLSHAISYAMTSYSTAWLKCHFPHEFFTSYLTYSNYKSDPKEEIYRLVQDARFFGINILPPDIRKRNVHFEMIDDSILFGLSHIRGIGQSAIDKIIAKENNLTTWGDFLASVPEFHRNVGIALIKSGACDCYGMGRNEMVRELEVILGTTINDETGKKIEVRGLTTKEKEYFFDQLNNSDTTTRDILIEMSASPDKTIKPILQRKKEEVIDVARLHLKEINGDIITKDGKFIYSNPNEKKIWLDNLFKMKKGDLIELIKLNGYKDIIKKSPCSTDKRRKIMGEKADLLKEQIKDTGAIMAAAEKHFLGIALSCSPADDADDSLATHTCLELAKAPNNDNIVVCAIIDGVKYTKTKKGRNPGQTMCFLTISDSTYSIDHAVVFPDVYNQLKSFCKEDLICLIYGQKNNGSFIIKDIQKLI